MAGRLRGKSCRKSGNWGYSNGCKEVRRRRRKIGMYAGFVLVGVLGLIIIKLLENVKEQVGYLQHKVGQLEAEQMEMSRSLNRRINEYGRDKRKINIVR
jgi:hypothetical protein